MLLINDRHKYLFFSLLVYGCLGSAVIAEETAAYHWQINRLMQPSEQEISKEKEKQQVFIYENLKLEDVEQALNANFDRIENMMFIGTILAPAAAGGEPQKEEDGCD